MASKRWSDNLRSFLVNATQKDNEPSKRVRINYSFSIKLEKIFVEISRLLLHVIVFITFQRSVRDSGVERRGSEIQRNTSVPGDPSKEGYIHIPVNKRISLTLPPETNSPL